MTQTRARGLLAQPVSGLRLVLFAFIDGQPLRDQDLSATGLIERVAAWLLAALPVTATAVYALAGVALASTGGLRALHQALIWTETAIGWLACLAARVAARRAGCGGVG